MSSSKICKAALHQHFSRETRLGHINDFEPQAQLARLSKRLQAYRTGRPYRKSTILCRPCMSIFSEIQGTSGLWSSYYNGKVAWELNNAVTVHCLRTGAQKSLKIGDHIPTRGQPLKITLSDRILLVTFSS